MSKWVMLVVGSTFGGVARYLLAGASYRMLGTSFPYGTLFVNLLGCFLIGLLDGLAAERFALTPEQRMLLMIGFCGAFTTFSTFLLETSNLLKDGDVLRAFTNVTASVIIGLLLLRCGEGLARAV